MQYESLAPNLRAWLADSIRRGATRGVIEQALRASGHPPKFARRAAQLALERHRPSGPAADAPQAGTVDPAVPAADLTSPAVSLLTTTSEIRAASPNAIETSDRKIDLLCALNAPRIVLFGGLLSEAECEQLIALARARLQRSTVVNVATGDYDVHPDRTSSGTHFSRGENELVARIERRIAEAIDGPVENGEPIQILHYTPGTQYKPHYDYFDPALPGNDKVLAMGGQRMATLVMYLNDVEAGGSTVFPKVGLDVLPRRGSAVYFAYATPDGQLDARTLHGGSPVAAGEKWIATKWLRQRAYGGPGT